MGEEIIPSVLYSGARVWPVYGFFSVKPGLTEYILYKFRAFSHRLKLAVDLSGHGV